MFSNVTLFMSLYLKNKHIEKLSIIVRLIDILQQIANLVSDFII